jgi:hypothetical protein
MQVFCLVCVSKGPPRLFENVRLEHSVNLGLKLSGAFRLPVGLYRLNHCIYNRFYWLEDMSHSKIAEPCPAVTQAPDLSFNNYGVRNL